MEIMDATFVTALASLVMSLATLVWAFRRRT
jgi:hypothetical protein